MTMKKNLILGILVIFIGIIGLLNSFTRITAYGRYKKILTSLGLILSGATLVFLELSNNRTSNN